jgi:uncharacterized RDD family membrane protein YckC
MSFPAGWYDDPQDPTQQRYWDGGFWTDYRRPREGPPPYQGQFGQPAQQEPGQQGFGPGLGQPGMGRQGYGPQGHAQQGFGYGPRVPSTPDGQQLAGWWKRVAARIIDSIIVFVIGLPFTGYFYYRYIQAINDSDLFATPAPGETPNFGTALPLEIYQWIIPASVLGLLVELAYSYFFLTRTGATPGKKAMGLSVRLRAVPGPPPGSTVLKRWASTSVFGFICGCLSLVDVLFPLWDDKKQALHDKIADTNVVVGPQRRR